ncbi:MAG TPA: hypothetical protein VF587_07890 [Solirubrobacteraceae bacterium]|jgi:hypothetical protein
MIRALSVGVAVAVVVAGLAFAQSGNRQTIDFGYAGGQEQPASSAGVFLKIDYVNPDDPEAKPYAVQTVIEKLADGTRFDTTVPEQCKASDQELMAQGAAACPEASLVGGGEAVLDTGPADSKQKVTQFNNQDELILLFEGDQPPSRAVSRAPIEGTTITAESPPLPGGPPDGYTALKKVDLELKPVSKDGRNYISTPPTCPAGGWQHEISFTYRDGEKQVVKDASPCRAADGTRQEPPATSEPRLQSSAPETTKPVVRLSGVPGRGCLRRTFRMAVRVQADGPVTVVARLGRRTLRRTARFARLHVQVPVWRLRPGAYRVRVAARDGDGDVGAATRRFRRC